jgi:outer membrane protein OmpA-like peptidoglycan-associated protein
MRKTIMVGLIATFMMSGCSTWEGMSDTSKGAMIGVLGGTVAGAAIGHGNRGRGALIGALGGGLAGTAVGYYMDSQAKDLHKVLAPEVNNGFIQVTKNADNTILVTMTANTSFDSSSSVVKPGFYPTLDKIAAVVKKYGKTTLAISGHTDSSGSNAINKPLSEHRARAVMNYFLGKSVIPERLSAVGLGASQPVANNNTLVGKTLNRRVEILIAPVTSN